MEVISEIFQEIKNRKSSLRSEILTQQKITYKRPKTTWHNREKPCSASRKRPTVHFAGKNPCLKSSTTIFESVLDGSTTKKRTVLLTTFDEFLALRSFWDSISLGTPRPTATFHGILLTGNFRKPLSLVLPGGSGTNTHQRRRTTNRVSWLPFLVVRGTDIYSKQTAVKQLFFDRTTTPAQPAIITYKLPFRQITTREKKTSPTQSDAYHRTDAALSLLDWPRLVRYAQHLLILVSWLVVASSRLLAVTRGENQIPSASEWGTLGQITVFDGQKR